MNKLTRPQLPWLISKLEDNDGARFCDRTPSCDVFHPHHLCFHVLCCNGTVGGLRSERVEKTASSFSATELSSERNPDVGAPDSTVSGDQPFGTGSNLVGSTADAVVPPKPASLLLKSGRDRCTYILRKTLRKE